MTEKKQIRRPFSHLAAGLCLLFFFGALFFESLSPVVQAASPDRDALDRFRRDCDDPFDVHATDHFLLLYTGEGAWATDVGNLLEEVRREFYHAFEKAGFDPKPHPHRLLWVRFSDDRDFDRYAGKADGMNLSWLSGYYSAHTNRVAVVDPQRSGPAEGSETTLTMETDRAAFTDGSRDLEGRDKKTFDLRQATHEAAHQLAFNSGVQTRGALYPFWISEGLAANFEANDAGEFGLEAENPERKARLLRAGREGRLIPFKEFVALTRVPVDGRATANEVYAQAWGMFRCFYSRRPEDMKAYLQVLNDAGPGWRSGRTLRREAVGVFGTLDAMQKEWDEFLRELD